MCIGFPGKIISINGNNVAIVDISGTRREISLDLIDEDVAAGDYVISHAGFALHRVDEEEAHETLDMLRELMSRENPQ
jgi:hydrogenase expression/formation protein HypC